MHTMICAQCSHCSWPRVLWLFTHAHIQTVCHWTKGCIVLNTLYHTAWHRIKIYIILYMCLCVHNVPFVWCACVSWFVVCLHSNRANISFWLLKTWRTYLFEFDSPFVFFFEFFLVSFQTRLNSAEIISDGEKPHKFGHIFVRFVRSHFGNYKFLMLLTVISVDTQNKLCILHKLHKSNWTGFRMISNQ